MNDIAELERRITAALERIGLGLDHLGGAMPVAADDSAEVERLTAALEDERSANAQLTERVKAIREKQEGVVGALERRVEDLSGQLDGAVEELKRLKEANAELAEANRALADGRLRYTDALGRRELREAIAAHYRRAYGIGVPVERGIDGLIELAIVAGRIGVPELVVARVRRILVLFQELD